MSALVRITTGIMPQHSRVGVSRAMLQFGEVIHCHKPPYSGIPGEDFVNVRFGNQASADRAYEALKAGQVFIDGFQVGVGAAPKALGSDAQFAIANGQRQAPRERPARSPSPPRQYARGVGRDPGARGGGDRREEKSDKRDQSPRSYARERNATRKRSRSTGRGGGGSRQFSAPAALEYEPPTGAAPRAGPRARTPSPDPPGPTKNMTQVKNPFYRPERLRSPSPDFEKQRAVMAY